MIDPDEKRGRQGWRSTLKHHKYTGNREKLWDSLLLTRQEYWPDLCIPAIFNDEDKRRQFCDGARANLGEPVSDNFVHRILQSMPQHCAYCDKEDWEWCDTCGGCPLCCGSEYHCFECDLPDGICRCDKPDLRDHQGNPAR
jgi:hypothetical protein